jgi:hypothetical protein
MDSFATRVDLLLLKLHPNGLIWQQHTYFQLGHIVHIVRRDPVSGPSIEGDRDVACWCLAVRQTCYDRTPLS